MANIEQSLADYKNNISAAYAQLNDMKSGLYDNKERNIVSPFVKSEKNLDSIVKKIHSNVDEIFNLAPKNSKYIFEKLSKYRYDPKLLNKLKEKKIKKINEGFYEDGEEILKFFNDKINKEVQEGYQRICKDGFSGSKKDADILNRVIWAKIMDSHDDILYKRKNLREEFNNLVHEEVDYLIAYT